MTPPKNFLLMKPTPSGSVCRVEQAVEWEGKESKTDKDDKEAKSSGGMEEMEKWRCEVRELEV